jgi:Zn-dependent protease with chaperone function
VDFFGRQDRARRQTRRLIVVFALAVVVVSAAVSVVVTLLLQGLDGTWQTPTREWFLGNAGLLGSALLATAAFILLASLVRHLRLRAGGGEVASSLGGEPVLPEDRDRGRQRLRNVVEEMSLAAGIPAPQAYVLEHERSINAFAAGHAPEDAAVAVTRGALDRLSRDELQGVVAHEFSHILNGDMRLNIRLMGYLFGILAVSTIGRFMLRAGGHRGMRSGRSGGTAVFALAGAAIFALGYAGVFCGRLIQAAVSRQREFLADAAAVQFTRQTEGLAGALGKIAGLNRHGWLDSARAEEVSHMLFASGRRGLARLFATHPPIEERLAALGAVVPEVDSAPGRDRARAVAGAVPTAAGVTSAVAADGTIDRFTDVGAGAATSLAAAAVAPAIGTRAADPGGCVRALRERLPANLWDAVHRSDRAVSGLLALLLDHAATVRDRQLGIIRNRLGASVAEEAATLAAALTGSAEEDRLALADLAFPVLRLQPAIRRDYLAATIDRLSSVDDEVDLFEAMLRARVAAALSGTKGPRPAAADDHALAAAATRLLAALALEQRGEPAAGAFAAGLARLAPEWPVSADTSLPGRRPPSPDLRRDLETLAGLAPSRARQCVDAFVAAAAADDRITPHEYAILRAVCGALGLPLPPSVALADATQSR